MTGYMGSLDGFSARSLRCQDCLNFDRGPGNFDSPNLRKCFAGGHKRWTGDDAGDCLDFTERAGSWVVPCGINLNEEARA